jgi:hypothetical protein
MELPFPLARIPNISVWDEYLDRDDVPYSAKFMDNVVRAIFIIELGKTIHEFFAEEILLQLRIQSEFICSLGSGRVAHMEADNLNSTM